MRLQVLHRMVTRKRYKPAALATLLSFALVTAGCSSDDDEGVPVDCKEGPAAVRTALARAPATVRLGDTLLSDCLARNSSAADLQQVGGAYLSVLAGLADEARRRPSGPATLRLAYLVGAIRRGAADTQGIHDEFLRRVDQELTGINTATDTYRRGYEAGRARG